MCEMCNLLILLDKFSTGIKDQSFIYLELKPVLTLQLVKGFANRQV